MAISDTFHVGAYYNSYKNEGFWEIKRTMSKAFIDYMFNNGINASVGLRTVNYEDNTDANSYKATIVELSLGYRWK